MEQQKLYDFAFSLIGNYGLFSSEDEVDEYFTPENMTYMFSGEVIPSQAQLDDVANWVVSCRWTAAASFWADPDAEDLAKLLLLVFDQDCKLDQAEVVEHLVSKRWASREVLASFSDSDWLDAWGTYRKGT